MRLQSADPSSLRALHIGGYWRGVNDIVRQMMLGLRSTGAHVEEYCTDEHMDALDTDGRPYDRGTSGPVWLRWEALQPVIDRVDPHLVICNAGGLSLRPDVAASLRRTHCLVGIALSDPDVFEPTTRHIAPNFDVFLTSDSGMVDAYRALGAASEALPLGTNEAFFRPVPPRPELACDVLVLGRAHADRVELVKRLMGEFSVHLYGEGWAEADLPARGFIYGDEALAALASATFTLVGFRTSGGHVLLKPQIFDFCAAGALVVTNHHAELARHFEFGREIVGFTSTEHLLEQLRYFRSRPVERAAIRNAGRARVLHDHTWRQVWHRILSKLARMT